MKIDMFVLNNFVNDSRVLREGKTLIENGHEVQVIALQEGNLPDEEYIDGLKVKRIHLKTKGLGKNKAFLLLKYFEFMFKTVKYSIKSKPEVIHAHDLSALPIGWLGKKVIKSKLVYDSHELWSDYSGKGKWPSFLYNLVIKLESFLIQHADKVITVSDSIAVHLKEKYKISHPIVIRNLPNYRLQKKTNNLRNHFKLDESKKILLYQGQISKGRGLGRLLDVASKLEDQYALILMGNGPYKSELMKKVNDKDLTKKVLFLDAIPSNKVLEYTASADIGIAPIENICLSYYFCLPNKLFEFLMAGLPVVCSDFPDMSRLVKENNVGDVFNIEDPNDIVRAINSTLEKYEKDPIISSRIKVVMEKNNWEIEKEKLINIYNSL